MRISLQTLIVIGTCVAGAALVFGLVSAQYQQIAALQKQAELSQLAQRDNRHLQLMSAQWLTTIDLFFGYQQSYLVGGISTQAEQLVAISRQFEELDNPDISTLAATLPESIRAVVALTGEAAIQADPDSDAWNESVTRTDAITASLIDQLDQLDSTVAQQLQMDTSLLAGANRRLQFVLGISCSLYILVMLLAWLWLNKSIVRPLEVLSAQTAQNKFSDDSIFLIGKAPREIVALSKGLHNFTARLAKAKNQVEKKKTELEENLQELQDTRLQLIQAEKLSSIGQLAAGIAHEINNPMSYIKSNLSTLTRYFDAFKRAIAGQEALFQAAADAPQTAGTHLQELRTLHEEEDFEFLIPDSQEILKDAVDGAVRIQGIVKDLYGFSHVNNNGYTQVNINDLVQQALRIVANQLSPDTKVVTRLGKIPVIIAEGDKLSQVFLNLLVNASHALNGGGQITLATGAKDRRVWLQVKDNGCGMPEDTLVKIFDPFFTTKDVGEGTGLGLHIVQEIIHSHSGKIDVKSAPGKGTVFSIVLPVEQAGYQADTVTPMQ
ncbi:hypothetical protein FKG94_15445 [Exilibacterium tricleocarpae]|uniref:histidine kinase n=1 Tax=Exilibacterium tricleocarpae TaxID=2591008 RepID=A0A545TFK4_9GAMM|nr:ATP-binding protein [Exilibacterium tricleocarpae]TQV76003.1 hypothetical protein FKG94_15445 [Exilibacterium tricleocarpae]